MIWQQPIGLGLVVKEKGAQITRIILLYQPCFSNGPMSMYQQYCCRLAWQCHTECPWKVVLMDLELELKQWQEDGEHIIVMTDFNKDVRLPWIKNFFVWMDLMEVLTLLMGPPATATHN